MRNATLEKLVWLLIYGGLLLLMFGLWTVSASPIGAALAGVGATAAVAGALLIWWRSRRPDGP